MDTAKLVAMISRATVCADCITNRLRAPPRQVHDALARISKGLKITTRVARCDNCLKQTVVYRIG